MAFRLTDCPAGFAHILSPKSHCVIFDDKLQLGQMARELPSCWGGLRSRQEATGRPVASGSTRRGWSDECADGRQGKRRDRLDRFRQALLDRGDEFAKIAEDAKTKGALHHRFGIGDGFVLVVDDWQDADAFTEFFSNPELQTFIASVGGDTSTPPDITVTEAISSPDEF